jgi:two-component system nitrate/nitrite sensor histidine kinase NarX
MRERAQRIGAVVQVDSSAGAGTCVRIDLPTLSATQEPRELPLSATAHPAHSVH